jgi:hypothetical protein
MATTFFHRSQLTIWMSPILSDGKHLVSITVSKPNFEGFELKQLLITSWLSSPPGPYRVVLSKTAACSAFNSGLFPSAPSEGYEVILLHVRVPTP